MRVLPLGLILFVLAPIAEIWLMIDIGSVIGAGWTILSIIATAIIGGTLVRYQGLGVYTRMNQSASRGELPAMEMIEGMALLISGLLLLTPGFITDTLGFLILIPPLRRWFALNMLKRVFIIPNTANPTTANNPSTGPKTVEGEFRRIGK